MRPLALLWITVIWVQLLASTCAAQGSDPAAFQMPGTGSLHFISNSGQLVSLENGATVNELLFKAATPRGDMYITTKGISYVFYRVKSKPAAPPAAIGDSAYRRRLRQAGPGRGEDFHCEVERV